MIEFDSRKTMTKKKWKELQKKNRVNFSFNTGTRDMGVATRAKRKQSLRKEISQALS